MDLRVQKTLKNIKEAFYQLRRKKPLKKISVKELSEIAMINKATFYLHYNDVFDLSEKLGNELISEFIDRVRQFDLRKGKNEFRLFAETISRAIVNHSEEIDLLFSGDEDNKFINRLEDSIKEYIFMTFPNIPNNNEINIIMTLYIQGTYYAYMRNTTINPDILIATTTSLFLKLLDV